MRSTSPNSRHSSGYNSLGFFGYHELLWRRVVYQETMKLRYKHHLAKDRWVLLQFLFASKLQVSNLTMGPQIFHEEDSYLQVFLELLFQTHIFNFPWNFPKRKSPSKITETFWARCVDVDTVSSINGTSCNSNKVNSKELAQHWKSQLDQPRNRVFILKNIHGTNAIFSYMENLIKINHEWM